MLSVAFFNLALGKKAPIVKVENKCKGIQITFEDSAGDELQIVLSPAGLAALYAALEKGGWTEEGAGFKKIALAQGPWPAPVPGQQLPA
ncbi:MAG: hypothetical protein ABSG19_12395 [Candidatus Aminicenantales bacterium]